MSSPGRELGPGWELTKGVSKLSNDNDELPNGVSKLVADNLTC